METQWRLTDSNLIKVVLLGDSTVGKTSLMKRFVTNKFSSNHKSTLGADFILHEVDVNGKTVRLQLWDTAGQERFKSLGSVLYRGSDACILTYDVTSPASFKSLENWRDEFLIRTNPDDVDRFPFIVVGNKVDLGNRSVTRQRAEKWCQERCNMAYLETSAKEGLNVSLLFRKVVSMALEKETENDADLIDDFRTVDLNVKKAKARGQCGC